MFLLDLSGIPKHGRFEHSQMQEKANERKRVQMPNGCKRPAFLCKHWIFRKIEGTQWNSVELSGNFSGPISRDTAILSLRYPISRDAS